jgi:hypothetical protein
MGATGQQIVFFLPSQIFLPNLPEVQQHYSSIAPNSLNWNLVTTA